MNFNEKHLYSRMPLLLVLVFWVFLSISGWTATGPLLNPDDFFLFAGELFNENKEAGAKQFQLFIKHFPKDKLVPEAEFMIGESLFELDSTSPEALKKFQRVVKKYSSNKQAESAAFRIAEIYYNRKNYIEALKALESAASKFPKGYLQYEIKLLMAKCYIILERFAEAEKILTSLVNGQPAYKDNERFNYIFGLVNFQLEKDDLALENLEKVDSPEALLFSSKVLIRKKKSLLAIEKLKEIINKYPESPLKERANYLVNEAFFAAKDYVSAIYSYEKFFQLYPQSKLRGPAIYKIGCAYFEKGDYLKARTNFQSFLQNDSQSEFAPLAVYLIGESFLKEDRFKEACFAYGDVVNSYPNNTYAPNAQYKLAWCYFNLENFEQAKSALIKYKLLHGNHHLLSYVELLLGNTFGRMERYQVAAEAYQRVIDQAKENEIREAALALMSRVNYLNENYTALVSGYRYISNFFPPSKSPWRLITYLYFAEGYLKQGLYSEALELYKTIQSVYPASPLLIYAQDGDAWANFFNENYSEAQDVREKIRNVSKQKELPEYIVLSSQYETANILFNRKKYLKALDIFDNYYKQNPEHYLAPGAYLRAGLCCYQLEYYGQAIDIWEELERKYAGKPEAGKALWRVADTYFKAQAYDKAIQTYNKILEKYIKDNEEATKAYLRIGQSYYNSKNYSMAVESLKNLILKFPEEPDSYEALDFLTALLEIPDSKGMASSALQDIVRSLGIKTPMAVEVQFRLARNYFENKNYSRTVEILEKLINELTESGRLADSNYYLGEAYYQLSDFDKAAQIFARFAENFPEDKRIISALFRLGSSHFKAENYGAATTAFEKLVQTYPDTEFSAAAIYNTALAYRKLGQWDNATHALQIYKEKYPDLAKSQSVDVDIVSMHEEQNQYRKAIEVLNANRRGLDMQSEAWGDLTFHIAENYMALGDEKSSVAEYQKIISSAGKLPNLWAINAMIRLGEYYEKKDEVKKAVSIYEKLYNKAKNMASKPPWLEAIKARIEAIRAELTGGKEQK